MGIITNIRNAIKGFQGNNGQNIPMGSYTTGRGVFNSFLNNRKRRAYLEEYTGWVYACVNLISDSVGDLEFTLKKGNKKDAPLLDEHPILNVLAKANPYMTKFEVLKSTQAYLDLEGNAFWYIVKNGRGVPLAIWPLRPDLVTVIPSKEEYIKGYVYTADGQKYGIPANDIIHFKNFNPVSPYRGMGVVEASSASIDADNYSREYNASFFANSARPDVILESPDTLSPDEQAKLLSSWKDAHGGPNKSNGVGILWGGLKATVLGTTAKDMDFVEQRRFSRDEILAMFRVPKPSLGIVEDVNYASAKTTDYVYTTRCIKPKMSRIVDTLNEFFIPMFGDDSLELGYVDPTPNNRVDELDEYQRGLASGWLTINEVRAREGLNDVKGGSSIYIDFSRSAVGSTEPRELIPEKTVKSIDRSTELAKGLSEAFAELKIAVDKDEEFETKGLARKDAIESRASSFEKDFAKEMTEFFNEQAERVETAMKDSKKATKGVNDFFDKSDEKKALIAALLDTFKEIFAVEGQASLDENAIEYSLDIESARIEKIINKNVNLYAGGVTDTTSDILKEVLSTGLSEGQSIDQIASTIKKSTAFSKDRAQTIARTEVITTQNMASVEAWKESGVVTKKSWYTAIDERVCPYCAALHGETISISGNFVDKNGNIEGYETNYRAIGEPALHPNCRCVVLAVVDVSKANELSENKRIAKETKELEEKRDQEIVTKAAKIKEYAELLRGYESE